LVDVAILPAGEESVPDRTYRDRMGKRHWVPVAWVVIALAVLSGAGVLLYQHWHSVVSVMLSPIGGLIAKVLFGGKVLKVFVVVGFAVLAGAAAVRRTLRRPSDPEPEPEALAAPVYGPPATEAAVQPAPAPPAETPPARVL
jgi:hypothetical protein